MADRSAWTYGIDLLVCPVSNLPDCLRVVEKGDKTAFFVEEFVFGSWQRIHSIVKGGTINVHLYQNEVPFDGKVFKVIQIVDDSE